MGFFVQDLQNSAIHKALDTTRIVYFRHNSTLGEDESSVG